MDIRPVFTFRSGRLNKNCISVVGVPLLIMASISAISSSEIERFRVTLSTIMKRVKYIDKNKIN